MEFQNIKKIIPGVVLALVFCLFSQGVNNLIAIELFGTPKSPISTVMIAILLGIVMGNEETGISNDLINRVQYIGKIPMTGAIAFWVPDNDIQEI